MDIENTKLPPNSIDSEQSVLGGLLLHNDSWDRVVNILSTNDFYQASHRIIYDAIKKGKEIVYINFFWKIIMFCINLIPEKIYKKFNF